MRHNAPTQRAIALRARYALRARATPRRAGYAYAYAYANVTVSNLIEMTISNIFTKNRVFVFFDSRFCIAR